MGRQLENQSFQTTCWSVVARASRDDSEALPAIEHLYSTYWTPLWAYARSRGCTKEECEDLVQGLFEAIIDRRAIAGASPEKGRFRHYLLRAFKNYMAKQWIRKRARKRGGTYRIVSLDRIPGDLLESLEPVEAVSAEASFDRQWAKIVLERAKIALRQRYRERGKEDLLDLLEPHLWGEPDLPNYREIGRRLGLAEGTIKAEVSRLRVRLQAEYQRALRAEIAQTVTDPGLINDELRSLMEAVSDG